MADQEQHSVKADTEYIVLLRSESGNWREDGKVVARDAATAIRETYESHSTAAGVSQPATFAAVPVRFWTALTVKPQVVTTLSLEQVKS